MKSITTKEKIVFLILLVFVSSVARAVGMKMAFSNTLIILAVLFLIYKLIIGKLKRLTRKKKELDSKKPLVEKNNNVQTKKT